MIKLNELDTRIKSIRNDLEIIEKAKRYMQEGNYKCTCDKNRFCDHNTRKECNIETIEIFKKCIIRTAGELDWYIK